MNAHGITTSFIQKRIEKPDGRVIAIEFKATENPASAHCRGLRSFREACPQAALFLFFRCPLKIEIGDVLVLPWQEGLELLLGDRAG